jgi:hypothetical protein
MDDICLSPELDGTLGMPTFEHSGEHRNFWEGRIGKLTPQWMQAGNKMQVPKEASRYHQEEFSFKGGSHPDNLIPTFF